MKRTPFSQSLICFLAIFSLIASTTGILGAAAQGIRILSPEKEARVSGELKVTISARLGDPIAYIMLSVDGTVTHSTNCSPYAIEVDTGELSEGPHLIQALAYNRYGLLAQSPAVRIYVKNRGAATPSKPAPLRPNEGRPLPIAAGKSTPPALAVPALATLGPQPEPFASPYRAASAQAVSRITSLPPALEGNPVPIAACSQIACPTETAASSGVALAGKPLLFDVPPQIQMGRMEVPFRPVFEALGGRVDWHPETRTAVGRSPDLQVELTVGERLARLNGKAVDLGQSIVIREGRVIVAVRPLAEALGLRVKYDSEQRMALLDSSTTCTASLIN